MKKNKTVDDDWYSKGKTKKYRKDKSKTFLSVRVNPRFV